MPRNRGARLPNEPPRQRMHINGSPLVEGANGEFFEQKHTWIRHNPDMVLLEFIHELQFAQDDLSNIGGHNLRLSELAIMQDNKNINLEQAFDVKIIYNIPEKLEDREARENVEREHDIFDRQVRHREYLRLREEFQNEPDPVNNPLPNPNMADGMLDFGIQGLNEVVMPQAAQNILNNIRRQRREQNEFINNIVMDPVNDE